MKRQIQHVLMGSPRLSIAARRWFGIARYLLRSPHDADFRYFKRFQGSGGLFLDIGANSGISALAYNIFDRSSRIVSLEPNPFLRGDLRLVRRLLGRKFSFRLEAAGAEDGELTLFVPIHRGIPLTGEASIDRDEAAHNWSARQLQIPDDQIEIDEVRVPVRRVDELGLSPHAVKIDVQGAELMVLEGMAATLERSHPVLMVEASEDTPTIIEHLEPLGYEPYWYDVAADDLVAYDGRAVTNVFFAVPRSATQTAAKSAAATSS